MSEPEPLVGENRCWPCTASNAAVAALVAGAPLAAAVLRGEFVVLVAALAWAIVVVAYTLYRLVSRGYLPGAETVARRTGLDERIGPGSSEGDVDAGEGRGNRREME